jgi:hypothetical protein
VARNMCHSTCSDGLFSPPWVGSHIGQHWGPSVEVLGCYLSHPALPTTTTVVSTELIIFVVVEWNLHGHLLLICKVVACVAVQCDCVLCPVQFCYFCSFVTSENDRLERTVHMNQVVVSDWQNWCRNLSDVTICFQRRSNETD